MAPAFQRAKRFRVEIVRRFVEKQEIRFAEDECGQRRPGALPAGKRREPCAGFCVKADISKHGRHSLLQEPVGRCDFLDRRLAPLGLPEQSQLGGGPEKIANGCFRLNLDALAQDPEPAVDGDRSGLRLQLPGDEFQERRLADAVAADKTCALWAEAQVETGKEAAAVSRGPREIGKGNGRRHEYGFSRLQGWLALRSGWNP